MAWSIQSLLEVPHVDLLFGKDELVRKDNWKAIDDDSHLRRIIISLLSLYPERDGFGKALTEDEVLTEVQNNS